jgi:hypothetical protein
MSSGRRSPGRGVRITRCAFSSPSVTAGSSRSTWPGCPNDSPRHPVRVTTNSREHTLTTTTNTAEYVDLAALPAYAELDLDDREILLAELTKTAAGAGEHSIRSSNRAARLHDLAHIGFLAGRLAVLESVELDGDQMMLGLGLATDASSPLGDAERAEFTKSYAALRKPRAAA